MTMATEIKSIPVLKDKAATAFVGNAEAAALKRATINFSKNLASTHSILQKAGMR
jgi:hypothetical protein